MSVQVINIRPVLSSQTIGHVVLQTFCGIHHSLFKRFYNDIYGRKSKDYFNRWHSQHKIHYQINHTGSADKMQSEGAIGLTKAIAEIGLAKAIAEMKSDTEQTMKLE